MVATSKGFAQISLRVARTAGRPSTFATSIGYIIARAVTGTVYGYSGARQLTIYTGITIVIFLIRNMQHWN